MPVTYANSVNGRRAPCCHPRVATVPGPAPALTPTPGMYSEEVLGLWHASAFLSRCLPINMIPRWSAMHSEDFCCDTSISFTDTLFSSGDVAPNPTYLERGR